MKMKFNVHKRIFSFTIIVFSFWILSGSFFIKAEDSNSDLVKHLKANVKGGEIFTLIDELSSDKYEGRLTGSDGFNKAAAFAANYFKNYGLQPIFEDYYQSFPLNYTKVYDSTFELTLLNEKGEKDVIKGEYFTHFYPLLFSGTGDVTAEIVFAGYGITAPEFNYDDYKGLDVKGKVVMLLAGEPKAKEGEDWSAYGQHRHRSQNAKKHGAAALLYVRGGLASPNGDFIKDFPMVTVTNEIGDKILVKKGLNIDKAKEALNTRVNQSYATGQRARIFVKSENFQEEGKNVVAVIPGSDPQLKKEFIFIGAHLDHCGQWPVMKPGAEDNGSGSAAVLSTAKALGLWKTPPKRSILFVLFGGEEMGLLGSTYLAEHLPPSIKPEQVKLLINMDMVGAGPNIFILGLKNHDYFEKTVTEAHQVLQAKSKLKGNEMKYPVRPNADHYPFAVRGIPAVSFFSADGDHHGYHSANDTIYWITPKVTENIVQIVSYSASVIANLPAIPK